MTILIEVLAFILLALPTTVEATLDYKEFKQEKRDKKALDVVLRGVAMLVLGVIVSWFTDHEFWKGALYSLGIFILLFDFIMGYLLVGDIFFLGTTSKTDGKIKKYKKHIVLVGRTVSFLCTAVIYYLT